MHLDSVLDRLLIIDSASADSVNAIRLSGDLDSQFAESLQLVRGLNAVDSIRPDSSEWAKLTASFFILAQASIEQGQTERATADFHRAAVYSLLLGDAKLRESALSAAGAAPDNDASAEHTAAASSASSSEVAGPADSAEPTGETSSAEPAAPTDQLPRHTAETEDTRDDNWPTAEEIAALEPTELVQTVNQLAVDVGTDNDSHLLTVVHEGYGVLENSYSKAYEAQDYDRTIQLADRILAGASSQIQPHKNLVVNACLHKALALSHRGYTAELKTAVGNLVRISSDYPDHSWAGRKLLECYHQLVSVPQAAPERSFLLQAAHAHFDKEPNMTDSLLCELEMGIEKQRNNDFVSAFSTYKTVVEKAHRAKAPAPFTKASYLFGDTWAFAVQMGKASANDGYGHTAQSYKAAISEFPEDEYKTKEEKIVLGDAYLRICFMLRSVPYARKYFDQALSYYALKAKELFEAAGNVVQMRQAEAMLGPSHRG